MQADLIEAIVQAENRFPQAFADMVTRDWGILFVTPTIPDSYDGNHACVLSRCDDPSVLVAEIASFYEERGLTPRVNYVSAGGDDPGLREALEADGFSVGYEDTMRVFLYRGPSCVKPNPNLHVERVDRVDTDMLGALTSVGSLRMAMVIQRRVPRANGWLFVGRINGQVASVALLERVGGICRVDEVHTAEAHRGKGGARAVVHAMVTYHQENISVPLYLWTDNPVAERVYLEAGFVKVDLSLSNWSAWRELRNAQGKRQ